MALQRWISSSDRGDEQAQAEPGKKQFNVLLVCQQQLSVDEKLIDRCPCFGRTSQRTGRNGVRCWCLAETSSCWSSAFGTSLYPERGQTSTSSDPTSSGWVTADRVHLIICSPGVFVTEKVWKWESGPKCLICARKMYSVIQPCVCTTRHKHLIFTHLHH